jgi:ATP-dependent Clp protease ATP-binding subunit ClpA
LISKFLKDEKSYASYLLKKLGIQRVDILEEIAHKEPDEDVEMNYNENKFTMNGGDNSDNENENNIDKNDS